MKYGSHKHYIQVTKIKRLAYKIFGEIHIPARIRANHVLKYLREEEVLNKDGVRYLDAGSGKGDMSFFLANRNPNWLVEGVEYEVVNIEACEKNNEFLDLKNISFYQGDLTALNKKASYDLITNMDVLEHIEKDQQVIRNFYQALAPDGRLVLTFPSNPQYPHLKAVSKRDKKYSITLEDSGHVRPGYSPQQIEKMLRDEGFVNVKAKYTFGWPGTRAFDLFFIIGDSKPNPIIFLLFFPLLLFLGWVDVKKTSHKLGSALLVTAQKDKDVN
ncbi:class I SAM-dependent methyltransferase [Desulfogranum marinum]|uniref:class I SAM-dependent methyltransferase n=1 Tax=Desulfogranum marinum TaxID=453220 RepID=UPI0029C64408|nr:class I SAM-dependent methyltransferase [Desulfogranum marinum]